jgi:hypothetical protein
MRVARADKPAGSAPSPKNWEADPLARESENVQMPVSVHTLLRLLRRSPVPDAPPPRVLGVDDWCATRSCICSCRNSRKEDLTWGSAPSAEPSLNQVRLGQCSRARKGGN